MNMKVDACAGLVPAQEMLGGALSKLGNPLVTHGLSSKPAHVPGLQTPLSPTMRKFIDEFCGTVETRELGATPRDARQGLTNFCAEGLHHSFKQDDERYTTLESTRNVVEDRARSKNPVEKIFVSYFQRTSLEGQRQFAGISTASIVPLDSPPMPQYGTGFLADFYTHPGFRRMGFGSATLGIAAAHASKAGVEGGVKLYAEAHNRDYYLKRGFHQVGAENIPNQDNPGETIAVTVFSSEQPDKAT